MDIFKSGIEDIAKGKKNQTLTITKELGMVNGSAIRLLWQCSG
jgi:hypothetical protein